MGQPVPGTAKGTRTPDLLIRSQSLYPTELPPHTSASAVPKYNNIPLQKMQALFSNNPNIFHIQQAGPHLTENGACSRITPDKAIGVIQQTAKLLFEVMVCAAPCLPLWGRWQPEGLTEEVFGVAFAKKRNKCSEAANLSRPRFARPPSPKGEGKNALNNNLSLCCSKPIA